MITAAKLSENLQLRNKRRKALRSNFQEEQGRVKLLKLIKQKGPWHNYRLLETAQTLEKIKFRPARDRIGTARLRSDNILDNIKPGREDGRIATEKSRTFGCTKAIEHMRFYNRAAKLLVKAAEMKEVTET